MKRIPWLNLRRISLIITVGLVGLPSFGGLQTSQQELAPGTFPLTGIRGASVLIEGSEFFDKGILDKEGLKTELELALRHNGLRIYSDDEQQTQNGAYDSYEMASALLGFFSAKNHSLALHELSQVKTLAAAWQPPRVLTAYLSVNGFCDDPQLIFMDVELRFSVYEPGDSLIGVTQVFFEGGSVLRSSKSQAEDQAVKIIREQCDAFANKWLSENQTDAGKR